MPNTGYTSEIYMLKGNTPMTGSTGSLVSGVDTHTMQRLAALLDVSQYGNDRVQRIAGMKDASLQFSGVIDQDNALEEGETYYLSVHPLGGSVAGTQTAFIIESVSESASAAGRQDFSVSTQGAGAAIVAAPIRA
jgi:hypothetical protein